MKPFILLFGLLYSHQSLAEKIFVNNLGFQLSNEWKCRGELDWSRCTKAGDQKAEAEITALLTEDESAKEPLAIEFALKFPSKEKFEDKAHIKVINNEPWVMFIRLSSERSNFFTRYLVTKKNGRLYLVKMSVNKRAYTKYANDFSHITESLQISREIPSSIKIVDKCEQVANSKCLAFRGTSVAEHSEVSRTSGDMIFKERTTALKVFKDENLHSGFQIESVAKPSDKSVKRLTWCSKASADFEICPVPSVTSFYCLKEVQNFKCNPTIK